MRCQPDVNIVKQALILRPRGKRDVGSPRSKWLAQNLARLDRNTPAASWRCGGGGFGGLNGAHSLL